MRFEDEIKQQKFKSQQHKAILNLLFTSGWITNKHKDFFKKFDLTPQQYNVLRILRGQHPESISTSEIKLRMLDKNSDTSRIVDRLALKKLVTKTVCPADRRLVDVVISKKGLKLLADMDAETDELDRGIGLNDDEARSLNELLDKMRSSL